MLSQKLSRISFKMTDLEEYEQQKRNRSDKAMDTSPELKAGAAPSPLLRTPRKTLLSMTQAIRNTPRSSGSFRSSTPEQNT